MNQVLKCFFQTLRQEEIDLELVIQNVSSYLEQTLEQINLAQLRQQIFETCKKIHFYKESKKNSQQPVKNDEMFIISENEWATLISDNARFQFCYIALFQGYLMASPESQSQKLSMLSMDEKEKEGTVACDKFFRQGFENIIEMYFETQNVQLKQCINMFLGRCLSKKQLMFNEKSIQKNLPQSSLTIMRIASKYIKSVVDLNVDYNHHKKQALIKTAQFQTKTLIKIFLKSGFLQETKNMSQIYDLVQSLVSQQNSQEYSKLYNYKTKFNIIKKGTEFHPLVYLLFQVIQNIQVEKYDLINQSQKLYQDIQKLLRNFFQQFMSEITNKQSSSYDFICLLLYQSTYKMHEYNTSVREFMVQQFILEVAQYQKKLIIERRFNQFFKQRLQGCLANLYSNITDSFMQLDQDLGQFTITQSKDSIPCHITGSTKNIFTISNGKGFQLNLTKKQIFSNLKLLEDSSLLTLYEDNPNQIMFPSLMVNFAFSSNFLRIQLIQNLIKQRFGKNLKKKSAVINLNQEQESDVQRFFDEYNIFNEENEILKAFPCNITWALTIGKLFQMLNSVEILTHKFIDDSLQTIRLRALECLGERLQNIKHLTSQFLIQVELKHLDKERLLQLVRLRTMDPNKLVRMKSIEILFNSLKIEDVKLEKDILPSYFDRMQDVDVSVRKLTIQMAKKHLEHFKDIPIQDQKTFFSFLVKRLDDTEEISNLAAQIISKFLYQEGPNLIDNFVLLLIQFTSVDQTSQELNMDQDKIKILLLRLCNQDQKDTFQIKQIFESTVQMTRKQVKQLIHPEIGDEIDLAPCIKSLNFLKILIEVEDHKCLKQSTPEIISAILDIALILIKKHSAYFNDLNWIKSLELIFYCLNLHLNHVEVIIDTKIGIKMEQISDVIEAMYLKTDPSSSYLKNMLLFQLNDMSLRAKSYERIMQKFDIAIKIIASKLIDLEGGQNLQDTDVFLLKYSMMIFSTYFDHIEVFIGKALKDPMNFFSNFLVPLYDLLLEMLTQQSAQQYSVQILQCIQSIWQKMPSFMFKCQDFLKQNLKNKKFDEAFVDAIFTLFYEKVNEATNASKKIIIDNSGSGETEVQTVMYLVKEIFLVTFYEHINSPKPKIRFIILKLLEILFDNQLTISLQFGPYLIGKLIDQDESIRAIAQDLFIKAINANEEHIQLSFQAGIKMMLKLARDQNKLLCYSEDCFSGYFTSVDARLKRVANFGNNSAVVKPYHSIVTRKLSELFKTDISSQEMYFVGCQICMLEFLSKSELKSILNELLDNIDEKLSKVENTLHQSMIQLQVTNFDDLVDQSARLLIRVFMALILLKSIESTQISLNTFVEGVLVINTTQGTLHSIQKNNKQTKEKKSSKQEKLVQFYQLNKDPELRKIVIVFENYIFGTTNYEKEPLILEISDSDQEEPQQKGQFHTRQESQMQRIQQNIDMAHELYRDFDLFEEYKNLHLKLLELLSINENHEVNQDNENQQQKDNRPKNKTRKGKSRSQSRQSSRRRGKRTSKSQNQRRPSKNRENDDQDFQVHKRSSRKRNVQRN